MLSSGVDMELVRDIDRRERVSVEKAVAAAARQRAVSRGKRPTRGQHQSPIERQNACLRGRDGSVSRGVPQEGGWRCCIDLKLQREGLAPRCGLASLLSEQVFEAPLMLVARAGADHGVAQQRCIWTIAMRAGQVVLLRWRSELFVQHTEAAGKVAASREALQAVTLSRLAPDFSVRTWEIQREKSHKLNRESNSRFLGANMGDSAGKVP
eukprot:SAG31_NODE_1460_length_8241_cov_11.816352_4_plen_210_part_00